jgi:hypothetical protein
LALAISFIIMMPFSIVLGANPIIVRNQATIIKPYETGYRDYGKTGGSRADANADYDTIDGRVFVFATASDVSNAWANASLEDDFEILHTSNYRITFSFNYKGLVEITGFDFLVPDFDLASVRIDLKVYLIDTSDRSIVSQRTRTIYQEDYSISNLPPSFPSYSVELADSIDVVLLPSLDESHVYDWRAELRTEVSATEEYGNDLQVTADFFSSDYGANIMQVRVVDLIPDNSPPVTTPVLSGTEGENGWYTSSVTVSLSAIDTGYGVENITY